MKRLSEVVMVVKNVKLETQDLPAGNYSCWYKRNNERQTTV